MCNRRARGTQFNQGPVSDISIRPQLLPWWKAAIARCQAKARRYETRIYSAS